MKNSLKFCLCALGKKIEYQSKKQFNAKYWIANVLPSYHILFNRVSQGEHF